MPIYICPDKDAACNEFSPAARCVDCPTLKQAEQPAMVTPYISQAHFDQAFPKVQPDLKALVQKVHKAKGRYHTQLAMCNLYDACGLANVRPADEVEQPTQLLQPAAVEFRSKQEELEACAAYFKCLYPDNPK